MNFFFELIGTQTGLLLAFVGTAAIVVASGVRLSIQGDALADRTGLGGGLVGLIFLAAVTSLPELVVSLTSVLQSADLAHGSNLATGNMLGSNVFNLLILAVLVVLFPKRFCLKNLKEPHLDYAVYGLIMLFFFTIAYVAANSYTQVIPGLGCGWATIALPIAYGIFLHRMHQQQKTEATEEQEHLPSETKLAQQPALQFYSILALLSLLIIGGGIMLSVLGSRMALPPEQGGFGLEASLIGTLFLAISTSLPELVVSIASVRMGFLDMAVGNVMGSNLFNLLIIFVADIAMRAGSMLHYASLKHWTSIGLILILTFLSGLLLRTRSPKTSIPVAITMLVFYIFALTTLM